MRYLLVWRQQWWDECDTGYHLLLDYLLLVLFIYEMVKEDLNVVSKLTRNYVSKTLHTKASFAKYQQTKQTNNVTHLHYINVAKCDTSIDAIDKRNNIPTHSKTPLPHSLVFQ